MIDPVTAYTIAVATGQFLEQTCTVANGLYDYLKKVKDAPAHSKELRREVMWVSDLLEDIHKDLTSNLKSVPSSKARKYADLCR